MVVARAASAGHHGQQAIGSVVKTPPLHFVIKGEHRDYHVKLCKVNATIQGIVHSEHREKLYNAVVDMRLGQNNATLYLTLSIESGTRNYIIEPDQETFGKVKVTAKGWLAFRESRQKGAVSVEKILNGFSIDRVRPYKDLDEGFWQVNDSK